MQERKPNNHGKAKEMKINNSIWAFQEGDRLLDGEGDFEPTRGQDLTENSKDVGVDAGCGEGEYARNATAGYAVCGGRLWRRHAVGTAATQRKFP